MADFWSEPTASGVPLSSVWKDHGHTFGYDPTEDGEFERWMDEHKPDWIVSIANIELWRAIWEAARRRYGHD